MQDVCSVDGIAAMSPAPPGFPALLGKGLLLPHIPHCARGIFLGGNWLIIPLLPFVYLSGCFPFRSSTGVSWSWDFPAMGAGWHGSAPCFGHPT